MPINWRELPRQTGEMKYFSPRREREYVIDGSTDYTAIQLKALEIAPPDDESIDIDGTPITIFLDRIRIDEAPGGGGVWSAKAIYESTADRTDLNFNFGAQSTKIYQALDTVLVYDCISGASGADGTLADIPAFNNAIGVNGDKVEGCDVEIAKVEFTITKKYARTALNPEYYNTLKRLTSPRTAVNDAAYTINILGQVITFQTGSLRFRGAQTKSSSSNESEITYSFSYEGPIVADDAFTVGSSANIVKEGHQYLWINYEDTVSNGVTVKRPLAVVINNVYPHDDFNVLDLDL